MFRRFGSKQNLIDAAYRREIRSVLRDTGERASRAATVRDCAEVITARLVEDAANNAAAQWMARVQPDNVVRLWRAPDPGGQKLGRVFISSLLQDRRLQDPLPPKDADLIADVLIRLVMSLVLVPDAEYRKTGSSQTADYIHQVVTRLLARYPS